MSVTSKDAPRSKLFNVPNQITTARLCLAILNFVLMPLRQHLAALIFFLLAAMTDWVDGYWARRFGQVTKWGRIWDPFVDKVIVCGMFIFLAAEPPSGIAPWMAVIVVARELLVTAVRSFIEQTGGDFSAKTSGKLKMALQCVAVSVSLVVLLAGGETAPSWLRWTLFVTVWLAVLSTIQSGIDYVVAAARCPRE
jgi:CDP-diacylglycerol---glycerol-3-phosphate 3-phosphatidyltransferase